MNKIMACLLIGLILNTFMPGNAFCQEKEDYIYTYGTVVEVTKDKITIEEVEYDEDTDEMITRNVEYRITPGTKMDNISSWKGIQKGNEVDIEYGVKEGKNEAKTIYLYVE